MAPNLRIILSRLFIGQKPQISRHLAALFRVISFQISTNISNIIWETQQVWEMLVLCGEWFNIYIWVTCSYLTNLSKIQQLKDLFVHRSLVCSGLNRNSSPCSTWCGLGCSKTGDWNNLKAHSCQLILADGRDLSVEAMAVIPPCGLDFLKTWQLSSKIKLPKGKRQAKTIAFSNLTLSNILC